MRFGASLVAAAVVLSSAPAPARADKTSVWVNPGVKAAYTFGEGFTLGVELSVVVVPGLTDPSLGDLLARGLFVGWGVVVNWDWVLGAPLSKLRLGAQWVGPGLGVEAGPSVVFDGDETFYGFGITPWAGMGGFPYYTYTYAARRPRNLHEFGFYLKAPLCVNGESACGRSSGWDLDD
jgi:hypothetical protein